MNGIVKRVRYRAALSAMPTPPCMVVDVGGGYGDFAQELRRRGYTVTVADVSGGDVYADAEQALPFADGQFDVAVCLAVAEHVVNWAGLLAELKRIAGRVVLTTPSPAAHPVLIAMAAFGLVPPDHIRDHKHYVRRGELRAAGYRHRYFVGGLNQIGVVP